VQRGVQQMGGGVIAHDVVAAGRVDFSNRLVADFRFAADHLADVRDKSGSGAADIGDFNLPADTKFASRQGGNHPRITNLAARFDVEAGARDDDFDPVANLGFADSAPVHNQG
jgi:hypothetical protein